MGGASVLTGVGRGDYREWREGRHQGPRGGQREEKAPVRGGREER